MRYQLATLASRGTSRLLVKETLPVAARALSIVGVQQQHVAPTITSRKAHAAPCFKLEEKLTLGVASPEELAKRIEKIIALQQDAQLCLRDCVEAKATDDFHEELQSAKISVDRIGVAYSELLEELALTDEGVGVLNELRKVYAPVVESLREELKNIGLEAEEKEEGPKSD